MKQDIHPKWHDDAVVTCACGNTFAVGSTVREIQIEICSKCHPFFTGEMKYVDTLGRVDKFKKKREQAQKIEAQRQKKREKEKAKEQREGREPKTLKEMLQAIQ